MNRTALSIPALVSVVLLMCSCRCASDATITNGDSPSRTSSARKNSDFTVKLHRLPDFQDGPRQLASVLRASGHTVVVITDTEDRPAGNAKENYSVIWIGKKVPVPVAVKAIQATRLEMPWVKYIFVQYENADWSNQLFLNAHDNWVKYLGLEPLSDADFVRISNENLSLDEFHKLIETYRE